MKKLFLFLLILFSCCARFDAQTHRLPAPQSPVTPVEPILMRPFTNDARCRQWVDSVLNKMSLKERIGQLFIYTIAPQQDKANRDLLRKVVDDYKVGGLLFSGGLMENQVALTNEAQKMADIPLMITFDGEWGLSFLRKTVLQGFVHDESAAFQGGVSGNAGLFSNATEVARIYQMLLNGGELDGKRYLSPETCRVFTTTVSRISRRGLGFDKPDRQNPAKSPCAAATPSTVYGHTGFTGTCAWVDPTNGLVYVFLCNRIYPNVWNTKLMKMDIRTRIQEVMYQAVK